MLRHIFYAKIGAKTRMHFYQIKMHLFWQNIQMCRTYILPRDHSDCNSRLPHYEKPVEFRTKRPPCLKGAVVRTARLGDTMLLCSISPLAIIPPSFAHSSQMPPPSPRGRLSTQKGRVDLNTSFYFPNFFRSFSRTSCKKLEVCCPKTQSLTKCSQLL